MNLISLNSILKNRLRLILTGLFPEYKSIKIQKVKGVDIVVFKKRWWHIKRAKSASVVDLCIHELPMRLNNLSIARGKGPLYNKLQSDLISLLYNGPILYNSYTDIISYLYDEYLNVYDKLTIHEEVNPVYVPLLLQKEKHILRLEFKNKRYSPNPSIIDALNQEVVNKKKKTSIIPYHWNIRQVVRFVYN